MKLTNILISALTISVIISGCSSKSADSQPEPAAVNTSQTQALPAQPQTESAMRGEPEDAWAAYFGDLYGAAVVLDPDENTCLIYNETLADVRE